MLVWEKITLHVGSGSYVSTEFIQSDTKFLLLINISTFSVLHTASFHPSHNVNKQRYTLWPCACID